MIAIAMEKWLYNGCTRHAHSDLSCMSSNMAQSTFETKFREKIFEKYSQCQKYLIPKEVYSQTIEDLKNEAEVPKTKSHHNYYILNRYFSVVMWRSSSRRESPQKTGQSTLQQ